jgi:hypothetical protein
MSVYVVRALPGRRGDTLLGAKNFMRTGARSWLVRV